MAEPRAQPGVDPGAAAGAGVASPPSPPAAPAATLVTAEQIEALRGRIGEADEATKPLLTAALDAGKASLDQQVESLAAAARFQQEVDGAPAALEAHRASLAAPAADPAAKVPPGSTLAELEQLLSQTRAQLEASRGQLATVEAEPATRQARRDAIPTELAAAQTALEAAEEVASAPPNAEVPALLTEARALAARAAVQASRARIQRLQKELASLEARRPNLQARIDLARRDVAERDALVKHLEAAVGTARQAEAQRALQEAQQARLNAAGQHPRVQETVQFTARLAARTADDPETGDSGTQTLSGRAVADVERARLDLQALAADYLSTIERVQAIGLTDAMGRLLREKRLRLADPLELEERIRLDRESRADALLSLFELRPLETEWGQPEQVAKRVADAEATLSQEERDALQLQLQGALQERLRTYRVLVTQLEQYQNALGQLTDLNRQRLRVLRAYIETIDETILWVPSHRPVGAGDVEEVARGIAWLVSADAWRTAVLGRHGLWDDVQERPVRTLGPLLASLVLTLLVRPLLARRSTLLHDRARKVATDSFRLTMRGLMIAVLIAAIPSAMLLALYLVLTGMGDAADQPRAVGLGLLSTSGVLFAMVLTRRVTRRNGLAEIHFRWPESVTQAIRTKFRWLTPLMLATYPVVGAMTVSPDTPGGPAVARVALAVWLAGVAMALGRLLRPRGPALAHFLSINPGGWVDRVRWLWYLLGVLAPALLAVIALLGYVETCRELESRFLDTLGLVLGLILVAALVTRWLTLARRRVAMEQSRRRREAMAARSAKELSSGASESEKPAVVEPDTSLEEIDTQTRQLLRFGVGLTAIFGVWAIWTSVLPALGMLERVELYPRMAVVEEQQQNLGWLRDLARANGATTTAAARAAGAEAGAATPAAPTGAPPANPEASGSAAPSGGASPIPGMGAAPASGSGTGSGGGVAAGGSGADAGVAGGSAFTLADVLIAIVLAVGTLVASRNIPGVAEIVLLQRLPLDRGSRYAVTTIIRYTILIIGVSATLSAVGIGWGKVQWLAAALTFGLGFGLQEIFANFVSGLIILAERPVRIGDIVTVNNTTGTVTKIRMRATTIMDYDKREMVVPNRAFITDAVINWTLSDPTTRIVIPVGVAYGSDVSLVRETLVKAGKSSTYLMPGRDPMALFRGFGASSLDFELRAWTRTIEEAHLARDELLRAVDRLFREAKIEIAFPQQDVHIRTINVPESLRLPGGPDAHRGSAESAGPGGPTGR